MGYAVWEGVAGVLEKGVVRMGFAREEKVFLDFCRQFGGKCRLLRRGWEDDGGRQREIMNQIGESVCLLTRYEGTLPEEGAAAVNKSRAKIYLPQTSEVRTGDCLEVDWGKESHRFVVCGQPQEYPAYTAVDVRKEEWI